MSPPRHPRQLRLPTRLETQGEKSGWGGARAGAGRPRRSQETVPHAARPALAGRPVHLTLRVRRDVWDLRSQRGFRQVALALRHERDLGVLRVVAFSVQGNHLHLVAEVSDARALSCRMKGFGARFARAMNRLMKRNGKVLAGRYHAVALRSPTQVRNTLRYVVDNHARHTTREGWAPPPVVDEYAGASVPALARGSPELVSAPRAWVLSGGFLRAR